MRAFFDTNVLVSAFATRGLCSDLFRSVVAAHEPIIGEVVLEELSRVLSSKFRVPAARVREVDAFLRAFELVSRPDKPDSTRTRDDSDRWILASAREAKVDVLVTGDNELLALGDLLDLRIRSPRALWKDIRRNER